MTIIFGQATSCSFCKGTGVLRGQPCRGCAGRGYTLPLKPEQGQLPSPGVTGSHHPSTSFEAEGLLSTVRAHKAYLRILDLLSGGELIDEAISDTLVLEGLSAVNGVRARRGELAHLGLIEIGTARRKTRANRWAQTWRLTLAGIALLASLERDGAYAP